MIKPRGNVITAKIVESEQLSKVGILLPSSVADSLAPKVAEVLAVGEGITDLQVGDQVVFKPYATYEIKLVGESYVMLENDDILGTVDKATKELPATNG